MKNEADDLISDLLKSWHHWSSGYQHVGGVSSSAMFRNAKPAKTREDDDGIDGALENARMEAINSQVMAMAPTQRTILQLHARNLACGAAVWNSPRLPASKDEREVVLLEAVNLLAKKLINDGVV